MFRTGAQEARKLSIPFKRAFSFDVFIDTHIKIEKSPSTAEKVDAVVGKTVGRGPSLKAPQSRGEDTNEDDEI